ncbi:DNA translocase FtsK 4TM domain-containing protein [Simkania negevensis]|uniref:DNA translocase FtsK 4TM domain-containing protein n=1 Tax=Simkania negevensis TaxID=83561 RepID=A0ABS3AQG8_9BACT|nr:DNA translocase FtsK 4TM domain-containing protein [Simkania negevensis]
MHKDEEREEEGERVPYPLRQLRGVALLGGAFLFAIALISFRFGKPHHNWLGLAGYSFSWLSIYLFGLGSYFILGYLICCGVRMARGKNPHSWPKELLSFSAALLSLSVLLSLFASTHPEAGGFFGSALYSDTYRAYLPLPSTTTVYYWGGVPFHALYTELPLVNFQYLLSNTGTVIVFTTLLVISLLFLFGLPLTAYTKPIVATAAFIGKKKQRLSLNDDTLFDEESLPVQKAGTLKPLLSNLDEVEEAVLTPLSLPAGYIEADVAPVKDVDEGELQATPVPYLSSMRPLSQLSLATQPKLPNLVGYKLPPPSLLTSSKKIDRSAVSKDLQRQAAVLEETLLSFGIEAKVDQIHSGPTVTRFEVQPAVGVKVQKITALESDIALNMQARSIRMIVPIPGKAAVGIEVPTPHPQEVSFKNMLCGYQKRGASCHIPILLGKTVTGEDVASDLTRMPHCIIAGATGSGKSVCINTIVISILMNARPDEIRLLMIDPKKVELTQYTQLPHMIAPVITEAEEAYIALNWLVAEMEKRYELLKALKLRNIAAFNQRKRNEKFEASLRLDVPKKMSYYVAIIDELADLMMVSNCDIETPIARIAQMARAVGIHLILATQRPSREVITGLIKANFPTRVAFKVASRVNSQIILDEVGAESLLGNGDMLFLAPGNTHLVRAQGAYIRDDDINQVVQYICKQLPPAYLINSFNPQTFEAARHGMSKIGPSSEETLDTLYGQAKKLVLETGNASTTFLQRKLKIGYARAASLMDLLERHAIVGPQEGSKARKIYYSSHDKPNEKKT